MPMSTAANAYIAIGSNIEPERQIPRSLSFLRQMRESRLAAESSWYRTLPGGFETQPDFINLVVRMETALSPRELLDETLEIEAKLNRARTFANGPRTIDLDILLFANLVFADSELTIPHPGLLFRDFMLVPLIEIAPDAVHPLRCVPVKLLEGEIRHRQILERLTSPTVSRGS